MNVVVLHALVDSRAALRFVASRLLVERVEFGGLALHLLHVAGEPSVDQLLALLLGQLG